MKITFLLLNALALHAGLCSSQSMKEADVPPPPSYQPQAGMVPNKNTAIQIAVAVLIPIYGADAVENQRPFVATLKDNIWTIVGTPSKKRVAGVAEIRIAKLDGRILYVMHGQ